MASKKIKPNQSQLFMDQYATHNPYWNSSLFNEVFLRNDLPKKYAHLWENDEIGPFYDFYTGFIELVQDLESDDFKTWKETDTINNWIKRVMELLGWADNCTRNQEPFSSEVSFTIQEDGSPKTYRPDLLYFDDPSHKKYVSKEKDAQCRLREARDKNTGVLIPLEAKYWDRLEEYRGGDSVGDKKRNNVKKDDNTGALSPDDQLLKYVHILKKDFGILSDGKTWRLLHGELSQGAVKKCFEFDLGNLIHLIEEGVDVGTNYQEFLHYAKYFYLFFSKDSHIQKTAGMPFVYEILEYSKKYASKIEDDLRKRFIVAMGYACNAVKLSIEDAGEEVDLDIVRNVAESHLFNILFFKSCEVRKILPIHKAPYLKHSLTEVIESIDYMRFDPSKEVDFYLPLFKRAFKGFDDWDGTYLYDRLMKLYKIVHKGTSKKDDFGFQITGFKESIFEKEEWRFAKSHKIDNRTMAMILFTLHFTESEFNERKYQQIPYSYFNPRQLGSIYESFLEFKLEEAEADMALLKGKWKKKKLNSKHIKLLNLSDNLMVKKGDLFFTPSNKERKMTGAFYTPDYIVEKVVKDSFNVVLDDKSSEEILQIKVCDPAMGSGHFLGSALEYLTLKYREQLQSEQKDDINESMEVSTRKVLDSCIYGVDINSRAVKLAKMSLWLVSAYPDRKLERLDNQLFSGNSVVTKTSGKVKGFDWIKTFGKGFFDIIVGNPPYISMKKFPKTEEMNYTKEYCLETFSTFNAKSDFFCCFIEKFLQSESSLKTGGVLGFVLSKTFAYEESYSVLRELMFSKNVTKLSWNDENAFPGVGVHTANINIVNSSHSKKNKIIFEEESSERYKFNLVNKVEQQLLKGVNKFIKNPTDKNISILKKIGYFPDKKKHHLSLSDVTTHKVGKKSVSGFKNGIASGDNSYWVVKDARSKKNAEDKFLSMGHKNLNVQKYYVGASISQFETLWLGHWINYLPDEMTSHSKKINTDKSKSKDGKSSARPRGYYYNEEDVFYKEKDFIVNSLISSDKIVCSLDSQKKYWDINVNIIFPSNEIIDKYSLIAILNSQLIGEFLMDNIRSGLSVTQGHLKTLPIKVPSNAQSVKLKKIIEEMEKGIVNKKSAMKKMNDIIFKLYDLSDDEIKYVIKTVNSFVEDTGSVHLEEKMAS